MNLDRAETQAIIVAGHIHDLGKMGQFHLTALNCAEYEGHRVAAQKAYDTPLRLLESVRLTPSIKNAVFHMYERFDGRGFPDKLVGKEIPLGARAARRSPTPTPTSRRTRAIRSARCSGPPRRWTCCSKHKGTIFDPSILDLFKALVLGEDMKAKLLASRYRVLLVDADPEESTVLELRMVEQGFDVKTARSVETARKLASAEGADFDLVVCELELPDADGLAFLSEARKEAWGRDMPWVVHTQKQGRTEANRAFELGAMDFVAKPVPGRRARREAQGDARSVVDRARREGRERQPSRDGAARHRAGALPRSQDRASSTCAPAGKNGEIHFLEGNIANAIIGDVTGADAFYALLKFAEGEFALDPASSRRSA